MGGERWRALRPYFFNAMHALSAVRPCACPAAKKVVGGGSTGESMGGARESMFGPVLLVASSAACPPSSVFPRVQEPKSDRGPEPRPHGGGMVMGQGARVVTVL